MPPKLHIEHELSQAEVAAERAERLGGLLSLSYEPMLVWQLNGPIEFWNTGADPPPLKWSDLRYVFDIQEDCNGKEAIQA